MGKRAVWLSAGFALVLASGFLWSIFRATNDHPSAVKVGQNSDQDPLMTSNSPTLETRDIPNHEPVGKKFHPDGFARLEEKAEWCLANLTSEELQLELLDVLSDWSDTRPEQALAWLESRSAALDAQFPLETLAPDLVLEPPDSLPPSNWRDEFPAAILSNWAQRDPAAAAEWLNKHLTVVSLSSIRAVLAPWLRADEKAALEWYLTQLDPVQKNELLPDLLLGLSGLENLQEALNEADQEIANQVLANLSKSLSHTDSNKALWLSEQISNDTLKADTQVVVGRRVGDRKTSLRRAQLHSDFSDQLVLPIP